MLGKKAKEPKGTPRSTSREEKTHRLPIYGHFSHEWDSHSFCLKCVVFDRPAQQIFPLDYPCVDGVKCGECQDWSTDQREVYDLKYQAIINLPEYPDPRAPEVF
jgi:hypothetical protein